MQKANLEQHGPYKTFATFATKKDCKYQRTLTNALQNILRECETTNCPAESFQGQKTVFTVHTRNQLGVFDFCQDLNSHQWVGIA